MGTKHRSVEFPQNAENDMADRILDCAIRQAELSSWEAVRLHHIAGELGITLGDMHKYFNQKDDLVEAWYDRADQAMLSDAASLDYQQLATRERLHRSIMCWLSAIENHRQISRDMLMYKFELGHVHLQVLGLLRISRTVQWILESAHRDTTHIQRVIEETAVTSIFLTTFSYWMFDNSDHSVKTRRFLDRLLQYTEGLARLFLPFNATKYTNTAQTSSQNLP